ncbi:MAG TPA: oxygen-dependent coproporphyrinogen oxidase [Bacteroidia bacterium]|nr:oxygen-dependent coproporphyrinogen oxidase [Bacteroidia bacterium]
MEINREEICSWLLALQGTICTELEGLDGKAEFENDHWVREGGGGGLTRVIRHGNIFEKGGVNYSAVHGIAPDFLISEKEHSMHASGHVDRPLFFACGLSIVIHPKNPMQPAIHMNVRYFELENGPHWLGGGIDLSPYYVNEEDARFFHRSLKAICDRHHSGYYARFKTWADDYFYLPHRQETRGIGGIFFDRLNQDEDLRFEQNLLFWKDVALGFSPLYLELIRRNLNKPYTPRHKRWQALRRGRYAEFNLVYDKGTRFGLETGGRTESILMSLPPMAEWDYNQMPEPGSEEAHTQNLLRKNITWV